MNESDQKELANYLDTEGYIGIVCCKTPAKRKTIRYIPMMILVNTEKGWLELVKQKWGGKISPKKSSNPRQEQAWQWHIHGDNLLQVLDQVRPHLKIKGVQCDLCRDLQHRVSLGIGIDLHHRLTSTERDYRSELFSKCKSLNAKGPKGEQLELAEDKPQLKLL
jgi:hypothetical protein